MRDYIMGYGIMRSWTLLLAKFLTFCLLVFSSSVGAIGADKTAYDKATADKTAGDSSAIAPYQAKGVKGVVIEEYMSLTCPHCATFHREIYPSLVRGVLTSEHVSFRYRDYPLDRVALAAAILSRCGGTSLRAKLVGAMMDRQDRLINSNEPLSVLLGILQLVGIDKQRAGVCLDDKALERAVLEEQLEGKRRHDISSTPSVVVAGEKLSGRLSEKNIVAAVNKALKRAGLPGYKN